ncbi:MAG: L-fuculose-phosphate aldolase [Gammaproteobacteria bacterium]
MRQALLGACLALDAEGLNHGHAGNISVRTPSGMLITPSGIAAGQLESNAMVQMRFDGNVYRSDDGGDNGGGHSGSLKPSSEWHLHAAVYHARDDLNAVVHAHPPYATALACARKSIPAFHYTVALSGASSIPCAPYATFGTPELATSIVETLGASGRACLMANHGILCASDNLEGALSLATEVEYLARVYSLTLQVGNAVILDEQEMQRVLARVKDYGQPQ